MDLSAKFLDLLKKSSALTWLSELNKIFHFEIRPPSRIRFCMFRIYLKTLSIHVQPENESVRSNHRCMKSNFSTDNYSLTGQNKPFKVACGILFCYVFGISVTYEFDSIFFLESPEVLSCSRCRQFCNKSIFWTICLKYEIDIILTIAVSIL